MKITYSRTKNGSKHISIRIILVIIATINTGGSFRLLETRKQKCKQCGRKLCNLHISPSMRTQVKLLKKSPATPTSLDTGPDDCCRMLLLSVPSRYRLGTCPRSLPGTGTAAKAAWQTGRLSFYSYSCSYSYSHCY